MVTDPEERGRRRRIIATTVITVALLAAVAGKVASMQVATKLGDEAWRSDDPALAERWFALTDRLNLVERWIAPYNRGVAAHGRGEWRAAATWFEQASGVAPESAHCRIALNWTWTLEAAGDDFADAGDEQTATLRWAEARRVLTEADGCDEGAASEQPPSPEPESPEPNDEGEDSDPADSERGRVDQTRERLEKKLEVGEQEPQQGPEEEAQEEQADRLTDRNREAARERRRNQDQREGRPDDGPDRTW